MTQAAATFQMGGSDSVELTVWNDGTLRVDCNSEWWGSTDTGFGASFGFSVDSEQAKALLAFLQQHVK
jgi:hypothetical protein